jgi:hypothetical protein
VYIYNMHRDTLKQVCVWKTTLYSPEIIHIVIHCTFICQCSVYIQNMHRDTLKQVCVWKTWLYSPEIIYIVIHCTFICQCSVLYIQNMYWDTLWHRFAMKNNLDLNLVNLWYILLFFWRVKKIYENNYLLKSIRK